MSGTNFKLMSSLAESPPLVSADKLRKSENQQTPAHTIFSGDTCRMWASYERSWEICGINNKCKFKSSYSPSSQHTCTHLGIKCYEQYMELLERNLSMQESPLRVLVDHCETIPAPARLIHALLTEVTKSHRKYNDVLHNIPLSAFCSGSSYVCPPVGMAASDVTVLELQLKEAQSLKSSTPFESYNLHNIPSVWWILAADCLEVICNTVRRCWCWIYSRWLIYYAFWTAYIEARKAQQLQMKISQENWSLKGSRQLFNEKHIFQVSSCIHVLTAHLSLATC